MLSVVVITSVGGFGSGVLLARAFSPVLADSREGRMVMWIVALLIGAAVGWLALQIYLSIYELSRPSAATQGEIPGFSAQVMTNFFHELILGTGPLLALAAIVHLLGPGAPDAAETPDQP